MESDKIQDIIKNFQSNGSIIQTIYRIITSKRMDNTKDIPHSIIKSTIKFSYLWIYSQHLSLSCPLYNIENASSFNNITMQ